MRIQPCAKINLGLNIVARRADGYHNLETVFYPVPIHDEITIEERPDDGRSRCLLTMNGNPIDGDPEKNLVVRAYHQLAQRYSLPPVNITLTKNIPMQAGMGGGSADGAFTLRLLNEMFQLGMTTEELEAAAVPLGADCAFFIQAKPAYAEGIGEILHPIDLSLDNYSLAIVKPPIAVSTREAFALISPMLTTVFIPQHAFHKRLYKHSWVEVSHLMTDHILFQDPIVEGICLDHWDVNHDRQLSISEAQAVTELGTAFTRNPLIHHFPELRFFTGLQTIDISAFDECTALETIILPITIKTIGDRAFGTCTKLEYIELPHHLEKIGSYAFTDAALRSIYLPNNVSELALHVFSGCKQLTTVSVSPNNPVYDSRDNCNAIIHTATNTMVSGGITATVPTSVTDFSDDALTGTRRVSFTIPPQIHHIGHWSLNFQRISYIYCQSPVPPTYDSQNGSNVMFIYHDDQPKDPIIYVPYGSLEAYREAEGWNYYADTIVEYPAPPAPNSTLFTPVFLTLPAPVQYTWH